LGIFYPKHYLIAVFRHLSAAQKATSKLRLAGFDEDEVIAVGGDDVLELEKEESGPASAVMQAASRFFATEQVSHDKDLNLAQQGAGFVAVHCPDQKTRDEAWAVLKPEAPLSARYYVNDGVEHLAGDFNTN
jgi:hypothetical protein